VERMSLPVTYSEQDLMRARELELIRKSDMGWGHENVARLIAEIRRETLEAAAKLVTTFPADDASDPWVRDLRMAAAIRGLADL
jgi:hypothetical protein